MTEQIELGGLLNTGSAIIIAAGERFLLFLRSNIRGITRFVIRKLQRRIDQFGT